MTGKFSKVAQKGISCLDDSKMLINDISKMIEEARNHVAREYNSTQVLLWWFIGKRINEEILLFQRAEYGENVIKHISDGLSHHYGRGYGKINLSRMVKFFRVFPDKTIISTLSKQLSWSHFILICAIDNELKRNFYAEMCRVQNWSVRALKKEMDSMLFERTVLSKQPDNVIQSQISKLQTQDEMSADFVFKDPYFIHFIGGKEYQSEEDLESLIINNITDFLHELGSDFCFVARQKRMSTGRKDRYLDLLFYNRKLNRLIAIDLKMGDFDPAYKGQMEWYLNWLDKNERLSREEKPVGIILCAGKDKDDIEYLDWDQTGIHVAQYVTDLHSREVLDQKLKQAISLAKEHFK